MKRRTTILTGVVFVLFLVMVYLVSASDSAVAAQAADTILRPLLGSKNTITLESWYFAVSDDLQKFRYSYQKRNANIFTSALASTSVKNASVSSEMMQLPPLTLSKQIPPFPSEGRWQTIPEKLFPGQTVLAKTFIRPDTERPYAVVSLVKMNLQELNVGVQAGTYYPGGSHGAYGPGIVPKSIQKANTLVAVFNGGFMEKDGHYGMIVGNKTYVPLREGLATLLVSSSGRASIVDYKGQSFGKDIIGIRQNGAFLVKGGQITPFVEKSADTWGRTTTNSMYTWRSGIGITKNGNLIYAVGNSLVPHTLAIALQRAGAVNAMQLDINPYWVRFILYTSDGNGNYTYYPLLKDMHNGGYAYLHGYNKDFFYIYKKS